jgi:hypothetical protein
LVWHDRREEPAQFLDLLRAGHSDYVINPEALADMRSRSLAGPIIRQLAEHEAKHFANRAAWQAHLDQLGISALKPDLNSARPH